ncbi:hypothetical protein L345_16598, partial [Ophiophagus hannah]
MHRAARRQEQLRQKGQLRRGAKGQEPLQEATLSLGVELVLRFGLVCLHKPWSRTQTGSIVLSPLPRSLPPATWKGGGRVEKANAIPGSRDSLTQNIKDRIFPEHHQIPHHDVTHQLLELCSDKEAKPGWVFLAFLHSAPSSLPGLGLSFSLSSLPVVRLTCAESMTATIMFNSSPLRRVSSGNWEGRERRMRTETTRAGKIEATEKQLDKPFIVENSVFWGEQCASSILLEAKGEEMNEEEEEAKMERDGEGGREGGRKGGREEGAGRRQGLGGGGRKGGGRGGRKKGGEEKKRKEGRKGDDDYGGRERVKGGEKGRGGGGKKGRLWRRKNRGGGEKEEGWCPHLRVDGRREVAEEPDVVLLAGLHVHHQAGVQVAQLGGLSEGLRGRFDPGTFEGGSLSVSDPRSPLLRRARTVRPPPATPTPPAALVEQVVPNLGLLLIQLRQEVQQDRETAVVFLHLAELGSRRGQREERGGAVSERGGKLWGSGLETRRLEVLVLTKSQMSSRLSHESRLGDSEPITRRLGVLVLPQPTSQGCCCGRNRRRKVCLDLFAASSYS